MTHYLFILSNKQTVSEFAAVQVFQVDEELHQHHQHHHQDLYRDRDRDGYQAGSSMCSPSNRVDR